MNYISLSSDFMFYLEDNLMYDYHSLVCQYDTAFYLKIKVGFCDLFYSPVISLFGIMNRYDLSVDIKVNVGLCELYCTVQ